MQSSPEEKDSSSSTSSTSIEMPSFSPITSSESISDTSSCCSVFEATPQFATTTIPSFKILGDNINKTIRPRQETSQNHTQSFHYFHSLGIKDRCDVSGLKDNPCQPDIASIDVDVLLPNEEDQMNYRENIAILMGRVVIKHCNFFQEEPETNKTSHIPPLLQSNGSNI